MAAPDSPGSDADSHAWAIPTRRDLTGLTFGDFQIERFLGHGGMGDVYKARQLRLDRPVAFKVLRKDLVTNPTAAARFVQEAMAVAKLNDPNIVQVYDSGTVGDIHYIAMEYVEGGRTLRDFLVKKGAPDLPIALSFMRQAGQAIRAAGERGLVHRDIKPENLLLTRKGQVKVADFGLCRAGAHDAEAVQLTPDGSTLGTPMYMSPEQVRGRELDHRSDLYSLGVTFYHMLAGQPPFKSDNPIALALKHVNETPVHLGVLRPDLPPGLTALVMKLMEKDPAKRYQTAADMLKDLAAVRDALAPAQTMVATGDLPAANGTGEATEAATGPTRVPMRISLPRPKLDRRLVAGVLGVALLGGIGLGVLARAENVFAEVEADGDDAPPALWMLDWRVIPKRETAERQYHFALLEAPASERAAAWLAVPGYYPGAKGLHQIAYTQLARTLYHDGDVERLEALAGALAASKLSSADEAARTARVAAAALRNDAEAVKGQFAGWSVDNMDPGRAELCLEAVSRVLSRTASGPSAGSLPKVRDSLFELLELPQAVRGRLVSER